MATPNSLNVVLETARKVNSDWCWPVAVASDVVDVLEHLGLAVLGVELWRFDEGAAPTVTGWTEYDVQMGEWAEIVADSASLAREAFFEHIGNLDIWVNLSWASEAELTDR